MGKLCGEQEKISLGGQYYGLGQSTEQFWTELDNTEQDWKNLDQIRQDLLSFLILLKTIKELFVYKEKLKNKLCHTYVPSLLQSYPGNSR